MYYVEYYCKLKRIREKIGDNITLARNALKQREIDVSNEKFLGKKKKRRIKFDDFCTEYLENAKLKKKSWKKSDWVQINALKTVFSGKYLDEITAKSIDQYIKKKKNTKTKTGENNIADSTINRQLSRLRSIFNKAIKWQDFDGRNPVNDVDFFKENNTIVEFLEKEEIPKVIKNCIEWKDIDFKRGIVTLIHTKTEDNRDIPMTNDARFTLTQLKKQQSESTFIFCDKNGKPNVNIRDAFKRALKKSSITRNFRWHDLRHTFASQLVMVGVDLNTVRELLGHKSLKMTLRYAHLSPQYKKEQIEVLNGLCGLDTYSTPDKSGNENSNMYLL